MGVYLRFWQEPQCHQDKRPGREMDGCRALSPARVDWPAFFVDELIIVPVQHAAESAKDRALLPSAAAGLRSRCDDAPGQPRER